MASFAASSVKGSTPGNGGVEKWLIGSATPQNMSTVPIPPAKSIVNHDRLVYSGREPLGPRRMCPCRDSAAHTRKPSQTFTPRMKNQPSLVTIHARPAAKASPMASGNSTRAITKTIMNPAEMKKIVGSVRSPRRRASCSNRQVPLA